MGDVIRFKRPKASEQHQGKTLCRRGFHAWERLDEQRFDTKQGRLVTAYRCKRCGRRKTEGQ